MSTVKNPLGSSSFQFLNFLQYSNYEFGCEIASGSYVFYAKCNLKKAPLIKERA